MSNQDETMRPDAASPDAVAFFDVDGTLIWRASSPAADVDQDPVERARTFAALRPTDATYDAFRRMRERGHATFICTGRPYFMIFDPLRELEPTGYIALAGAYVRVGDTVIRDECIPFDVVMETAKLFFEAGIDVELESIDKVIGLYASDGSCFFPGSETVHSLDAFEGLARRYRFAKFCTRSAPAGAVDRARAFCSDHFTVCNMRFGTHEFSLKGVDKGTGIAAALNYLEHGRARTFAFGDSENDLSMADAVDTFVAMGNAMPSVRERAAYVTARPEDDGVAAGLVHFGLA